MKFVSLGYSPITAEFLKRSGFDLVETVFDSMILDVGTIIHCLADDFATMLDPKSYETKAMSSAVKTGDCSDGEVLTYVELEVPIIYADRSHLRDCAMVNLKHSIADIGPQVEATRLILSSGERINFVYISRIERVVEPSQFRFLVQDILYRHTNAYRNYHFLFFALISSSEDPTNEDPPVILSKKTDRHLTVVQIKVSRAMADSLTEWIGGGRESALILQYLKERFGSN